MKFRQFFPQRLRRRIRIQPQPPIHRRLDRVQHFGDGGYGFSFVFSLINPLIFGCSPGT